MEQVKGRIGNEVQDAQGNDVVELLVPGSEEPWHLMIHPSEPKPVKGEYKIAHGIIVFHPDAAPNPLMSVRFLESAPESGGQMAVAVNE
jgi:hypothetical protein